MSKFNRRNFLKATAAAGAGYWLTANAVSATRAADKPNGKIHFAGIGVGGKGSSDIDHCWLVEGGQVVALCDCDENHMNGKFNQKGLNGRPKEDQKQYYLQAKKFPDYRKMLDEMGKDIDAVTVSTADHTHAPASFMAMKMGKHVYCQKPLTHDVWEARQMRLIARENKVCTQMGNQGSAENGLRRAVEIVRAGVLGKVTEVHVWTNRPTGFWKQAPEVTKRPSGKFDVPKHVHWDLFLGTAPERDYAPGYHPFAWRGWWDFGTGALGDMACHTANMAYRACQLGYPTTVKAECGPVNPETCVAHAHVVLEFPARGDLAPVTWNWYEGTKDGKKLAPPASLLEKILRTGEKLAGSGSILVGDKGILFSPNDYGASYRLIGDGVEDAAKKVSESLPRNGKGDVGMKQEWAQAIRENNPSIAYSNFDIAGPLTECVLLGNVAVRTGKALEFDGDRCEVTNCKDAAQYLKREYRKGWQA